MRNTKLIDQGWLFKKDADFSPDMMLRTSRHSICRTPGTVLTGRTAATTISAGRAVLSSPLPLRTCPKAQSAIFNSTA